MFRSVSCDITYNAASVAVNSPIGVIGLSGFAVNYGELNETIRYDNTQGFRQIGTYSPSATVIGLGYAKAVTNRFAVGGNAKYVAQSIVDGIVSLDDNENPVRKNFALNTIAWDFGVFYQTGFRSLDFALGIKNFSRELTYSRESFELPLIFRIGLSMDMMDLMPLDSPNHNLLLAIDSEHPRDYDERVKVGAEYVFMNTLALRGGYIYPTDEQGLNAGIGVQREFGAFGVNLDYAYSQYGVFGSVNRFSVQFSF